jgi:hypothetical protein
MHSILSFILFLFYIAGGTTTISAGFRGRPLHELMAIAMRELEGGSQQCDLKQLYYAFEAAWRLNKQQAGEQALEVLKKLQMASGAGAAAGHANMIERA